MDFYYTFCSHINKKENALYNCVTLQSMFTLLSYLVLNNNAMKWNVEL